MKRENHRASSEDDDPQPTLEETQLTVADEAEDGETTVMEEETREDGTREEQSRIEESRIEEEEQQTAEGKQLKATDTDQSPMVAVVSVRARSAGPSAGMGCSPDWGG